MGKTVIFGGTFNPIHRAHIKMLEETAKLSFVDKILVIPTKIPPHKSFIDSLSGEIRLQMCKIATKDIKKVQCCDIELGLPDKSYTINTVNVLLEQNKDTEFSILIGGDMLDSFKKWYCYKELLKKVSLLVVKRNTINDEKFEIAKRKLENENAEIIVLDIETEPISSSEIRERIKLGENVEEYLTNDVLEFINKNNLYRSLK